MNSKPGDKFSSKIITISDLKWQINIYPNGSSSDGFDTNAFQVFLHLISMPSSWSQIIATFRAYCHETLSRYTLIVRYTQGEDCSWPRTTCLLSEIKKLSPKSLNITVSINILKIILKNNSNNNNLCIYPSTRNHHHILSSKYNIQWTISNSLISNIFKYPHNGKTIESDIYYDMFCLRCMLSPQKGYMSLYLQLCSFPMHTSKIKIKFRLTCNELDKTEETVLDFSLDDSGWGWTKYCQLSKVKLLNTSITFNADIKLLNQYDLNGNNIFINYQSAEHESLITHKDIVNKLESLQSQINDMKQSKSDKHEKEENDDENGEDKKEEMNSDCMNGDYRSALLELISFIENPQPKYEYISDKISKLKKIIFSKYDMSKYKIEGDEKHKDHFGAILKYLRQNGENREEVEIINGDQIMHQLQLLVIYTIKNHERVKKLNDEQGLKSLHKIYKGTVIGEYYGNEYLEHEFDAIYSNTIDLSEINAYSFAECIEVDIDVGLVNHFTFNSKIEKDTPNCNNRNNKNKRKLCEENDNNNRNNKRRKLNNGNGINMKCVSDNESDFEIDPNDNIKTVKQEFKIVIDGRGPHKKSILIYMNDCKKYLNFTEATKMDEKYRNINLITVYVNGWPRIFAIATKDIEKNEEILADYGSAYVGVKQQKMLYKDNMTYLQNNINKICTKHGINYKYK